MVMITKSFFIFDSNWHSRTFFKLYLDYLTYNSIRTRNTFSIKRKKNHAVKRNSGKDSDGYSNFYFVILLLIN